MSNEDTTLATIESIASEVVAERLEQIAQWGEQDHASTWSPQDQRQAARTADYWKQINNARVELDGLTWDGILLEEVYEALAEADPLLRRMELIQVAAVAMAEVESIDRNILNAESTEEIEDSETDQDA